MRVLKLRSDEEFIIHYDDKPLLTHNSIKSLSQLKKCGMQGFIDTTFNSLRKQSDEGVSIEPVDIDCVKNMVDFFHNLHSHK